MDNLIKDLIKQYSELEKYKSNNPFCNNHKSELKKNIDYNFDKFINLKQQLQCYYFSTQDFKPIIYKMQEAKNDFNNQYIYKVIFKKFNDILNEIISHVYG